MTEPFMLRFSTATCVPSSNAPRVTCTDVRICLPGAQTPTGSVVTAMKVCSTVASIAGEVSVSGGAAVVVD